MCKRIFKFELQLSSYWQNIKLYIGICNPKSYISVNLGKKGLKLCIFSLQKYPLDRERFAQALGVWASHVENLPKPLCIIKNLLFLFSWLNFASVLPISPCHDVSIERLSCHVFRCNDDIFRRGILYFSWGIRLDIKKPIVYPEKTAI